MTKTWQITVHHFTVLIIDDVYCASSHLSCYYQNFDYGHRLPGRRRYACDSIKQQAFKTLKFILHKYDEQAVAVVGEKFLRGIFNNSGGGNVNKYPGENVSDAHFEPWSIKAIKSILGPSVFRWWIALQISAMFPFIQICGCCMREDAIIIFPSYRYVVVCEKSLLFGMDVNTGRKYHAQLTSLQRDVKKSTLLVEQLNKNGEMREMGENW